MPLISSAGNCGPRCLLKAFGWGENRLHEVKQLSGHVDGHGVDPAGIVKGFRSQGWRATWSEHNTLEKCIDFLGEHKKSVVVLDYFDYFFGSSDGHYVIFYGLNPYGDLRVWNPDTPDKEEMLIPRAKFELEWYDYTIEVQKLIKNVAIFAHK